MIKQKYLGAVTAVIIVSCMGIIMSFIMTAVNTGFTQGFILRWLRSFAAGVALAIPVSIFVIPRLTKQIQKLVKD